MGQAFLDVAFKPAAGALGLVADPIKGMVMDFQRQSFGKDHPFLGPRNDLSRFEYDQSSQAERQAVLEAFKVAVRTIGMRKQEYMLVAEAEARALEEDRTRMAQDALLQ